MSNDTKVMIKEGLAILVGLVILIPTGYLIMERENVKYSAYRNLAKINVSQPSVNRIIELEKMLSLEKAKVKTLQEILRKNHK